MTSFPDTLQVLRSRFASMPWSLSILSFRPSSSSFLRPEEHFLNKLLSTTSSSFTQQIFLLLPWRYGPVGTFKAEVPELDYLTNSSVKISNQSDVIHNNYLQLSTVWQKLNYLPAWSNVNLQLTLFQNPSNSAIRWFNVISRTLTGGSYSFAMILSLYSTATADWALH